MYKKKNSYFNYKNKQNIKILKYYTYNINFFFFTS